MISKDVKKIFKFLENQFGMLYREDDPNRVVYYSDNLKLEFTYNKRDGIDLLAKSISLNKEFSFSTLIDAIDTYLGRYEETSLDKLTDHNSIVSKIESFAVFLQENFKKLFINDSKIFILCCELRFWHIGKWTKEWGKSIEMSDEDIRKAGSLVPAIIKMLHSIPGKH